MDTWGDDERTNTAIEHLRLMAAKIGADGMVVPRHRYTRSLERVTGFLETLVWAPRYQRFSLEHRMEDGRTVVTATIEVESQDGASWTQKGIVSSGEGFYSWDAMAVCRALLNYTDDDDEPMTPDQVLAMFERQRAEYMAKRKVNDG